MSDITTELVFQDTGDLEPEGGGEFRPSLSYINEAGVPEIVAEEVLQHQEVAKSIENWMRNLGKQVSGPSRRRRSWDVFSRDDYEQPHHIFEVMAQCAMATEEDDILSTLVETVEGQTFTKMGFEADDPDQADIWNQWAGEVDLDSRVREIFRELFKVSQAYIGLWWEQRVYTVRTKPNPNGGESPGKGNRKRKKQFPIVVPTSITVFDPTKVVPVGMLMFNRERFAYVADEEEDKAFSSIVAGEVGDSVVQRMIAGRYTPQSQRERDELSDIGVDIKRLWLFREGAVFRHTLTRAQYERFAKVRLKPILPILELKHHLRSADRAALIGATNFIVVITKGTDKFPARQAEVENLREQAKVVARMPILVGDHRLNVEIVTPALDNTLIESRYQTLDARLVFKALQSFHPQTQGGTGGSQIKDISKIVARGLENRRHQMVRALEKDIFRRAVEVNEGILDEVPHLSFMPRRISLEFNADIVKAVMEIRDRGDMSRETMLEELDYDQDTEMVRRMRERDDGADDVFQTHVPYDSPQGTPQQTGKQGGRPTGVTETEERSGS